MEKNSVRALNFKELYPYATKYTILLEYWAEQELWCAKTNSLFLDTEAWEEDPQQAVDVLLNMVEDTCELLVEKGEDIPKPAF